MTRQEAMRRLEGSWAFETTAGGVLVADVALLERVAEITGRGDGAMGVPPTAGRRDAVSDSRLESAAG